VIERPAGLNAASVAGVKSQPDLLAAASRPAFMLPAPPYRQWVLSLPYRVRVLCAYDPVAAAALRGLAAGCWRRGLRHRNLCQ
jgi:hypothetical protein